jgi:hypothetical protein
VILLDNSNEWNLSLAKEGSSEKRREQGLKSKRGETSYEEAPCFKRKKEREWDLHAAGRDSIKRKKERRSHFPIV